MLLLLHVQLLHYTSLTAADRLDCVVMRQPLSEKKASD
jgi:hypothetical protein